MLYLILAIICGTAFAVLFKVFACKGIDSLQAILFNYLTAFCLGVAFNAGGTAGFVVPFGREWFPLAVLMGAMFMSAFVLMSLSTAKTGVAVTTISARVSLVIPVLCSYLLLPGQPEPDWFSIFLIACSLVLMFMPIERKADNTISVSSLVYPLSVFLLFGLNNFCLKYVQNGISEKGELASLTSTVFLSAAVVCGAYYFLRKNGARKFAWKNLAGGVALGTANFFATYLTLLALGAMPASLFFPLYHVGIVVLAVILGVTVFGEKLSAYRIAGIVMAIAGIIAFFI